MSKTFSYFLQHQGPFCSRSRIIKYMLKLSQNITDIPIMSLRTGHKVGTAKRPIINPNKLRVEGWYCHDIFSGQQLVLPFSEVRELIPQGLAVNDHDAMTEPEDIIRLQEIIDIDFQIIGKQVVTNHKRKLGKAIDYAVDPDTMKIEKIYISRPIYKSLTDGQLVVDRSQIIETTNKKIIIRDSDIKIESRNISPIPASA